jgi:hypothetical protein
MSREEAIRSLHSFAQPLFRQSLVFAHALVEPSLEEIRREGFQSDFSLRLDRALRRFYSRFDPERVRAEARAKGRPEGEIAQELSIIPELREEFEKLGDIAVVLAELERYHFPRWVRWLVEDLKAEGCLE